MLAIAFDIDVGVTENKLLQKNVKDAHDIPYKTVFEQPSMMSGGVDITASNNASFSKLSTTSLTSENGDINCSGTNAKLTVYCELN